jgi:hypothetical protein
MARVGLILVLLAAGHAAGAGDAYQSAAAKINLVREEKAKPGSRIRLSLEEINAYAAVEALKSVPQGLGGTRVELGRGTATGHAWVDFAKVRHPQTETPVFFLGWLLAGERPVQAKARIDSGRGRATVHLEELRLAGVPARGPVLAFLIEHFLLPFYPNAVIGQPFELKHRVERLEILPSGVTVYISR